MARRKLRGKCNTLCSVCSVGSVGSVGSASTPPAPVCARGRGESLQRRAAHSVSAVGLC